ncbi:helix-turn-helix transcriptional regulator [Paenibacillus sp. IB182493]|uniref:Helix-turn-helix transcriptional regulator n=2 Tax=Paenibacillus arenilitoris TaxID=2772299 RepID=A0A927CK64_9BACL|nr:helix-turn-helix transcriptional regulator [Paenibacillus arenilitoris]
MISSKWVVLVIYAMEDGPVRYGEFSRRIEGISKKMLTQTLRQLERDGLIERDIHPTVPPAVEYRLTALGESLLPFMRQLKTWAAANLPLVEAARTRFDAQSLAE